MLRESIQVVENVDLDAKLGRGELKLKLKDDQINQSQE